MSAAPVGSRLPDVAGLCSDLIQINTSNPTHTEERAAQYVVGVLTRAGVAHESFEPAPGRVSVVARLPGLDRSRPPLLVHTHLDTVPAAPEEWSTDPFAGEIRDGYVWGRGAVDMKGMVAAVLAVVEDLAASGRQPARDVVLAFFADEEAGGALGAGHVTRTRPDLFAGCEEAIGEVGGFSQRLSSDQRCYVVSTAEKGVLWAGLSATGRSGHGSMLNDENAVSAVCTAVARIAAHHFPDEDDPTTRSFLDGVADLLGRAGEGDEAVLTAIGPLARMIRAGMRNTLNPTSIAGGYKVNVIPAEARATIDGRYLPGQEEAFTRTLHELAGPDVDVEVLYAGRSVESPWAGSLIDAMHRALLQEDPTAVLIPYMSTAFTDAKWLSELGIRCYGFCPLQLPDDLDFTALFHGRDERVPVASLEFCVRVLSHLLLEDAPRRPQVDGPKALTTTPSWLAGTQELATVEPHVGQSADVAGRPLAG